MKIFISILLLIIINICSCRSQLNTTQEKSNLKFLYKTAFDTSSSNKGQHIEIKQILPHSDELIPMTIDDRDIIARSKYSKEDVIKILGEYLTFLGDTNISNKKYHFKPAYHMERPDTKGFTIQIEALYSLTRLLSIGYPSIKPVLIDCSTGEEINNNRQKINLVYKTYRNWFKENLKSNFENIRPPLEGTHYCWLGQETGKEVVFKKSL